MGDPERRKRTTLADVAKASQVSPAAASLALRGEPGVSDDTRDRVNEAARRLGYRGVRRSADVRERRLTFGLIIKSKPEDAPETNRFYAPVMAGVEEVCRARGVDLLLAALPVDDRYFPLEVPRFVTERSCDGLVVIGARFSHGTARLLEDGPPAVLVDAYAEDGVFDSVRSDNVAGARAAVDHLIDLGHREIALVGTQPDSFPSIVERRRGYQNAVAEAGLGAHIVDGPHLEPELAAAEAVAYLEAHPEVTAAFCSNDDVAMALSQAARAAGIDVPGRLSIVGYDDIDPAQFVTPPLTTLAVDKLGMGRLAAALLLLRLEFRDAAPVQALIRPRLVERGSARAVGSRAIPAGERGRSG